MKAMAATALFRRFVDYVGYLAMRIFICIVQSCSIDLCERIASFAAWLIADVLHLRESTTLGNIQKAFPHLPEPQQRRLVRKMWRHLLIMLCEIAHSPRRIHRNNWRNYVHVRNEQLLVGRLISERPTVTVTGHFGNFEMAGYLSGLFGFPTYTIARPLDNPFIHDFVNAFRGATGQFILSKDGSSGEVQRILDQGQTLALLADQHAGPKGCWVEMFGQPTSCHKAVALFSLSSGAPQALVWAKRERAMLHFELICADVYDPAEDPARSHTVTTLSQWYLDYLEAIICEAPEQYWWVHRIWRGERPKRRKRKRTAQAA